MAIYVYRISDGELHSWCPNDTDPVAPPAELAANGMASKSGLHPLDPTHHWDPATTTVVVVAAPTIAAPMPLVFFLQRFTPAEYSGISASTDPAMQQFWDVIRRANVVDLTDPAIISSGQRMVTLGLLTAARANTILTTPYAPTSETS